MVIVINWTPQPIPVLLLSFFLCCRRNLLNRGRRIIANETDIISFRQHSAEGHVQIIYQIYTPTKVKRHVINFVNFVNIFFNIYLFLTCGFCDHIFVNINFNLTGDTSSIDYFVLCKNRFQTKGAAPLRITLKTETENRLLHNTK